MIENNTRMLDGGDDLGETKQRQQMDSSSQFIHSFRQGLPSASVHAHVPCMNTNCISISCSKYSHKFHRDTLLLQKAKMDIVEQVLPSVTQKCTLQQVSRSHYNAQKYTHAHALNAM